MGNSIKDEAPFVLVEWDDAWKSSTDDTTFEDAGDSHKPIRCSTVGWLLRDNEVGVQIANECSPNGTYRGRTFILRSMVVNVIPIKLPKVRQKKPIPPI